VKCRRKNKIRVYRLARIASHDVLKDCDFKLQGSTSHFIIGYATLKPIIHQDALTEEFLSKYPCIFSHCPSLDMLHLTKIHVHVQRGKKKKDRWTDSIF
jgi:hypothetical protein